MSEEDAFLDGIAADRADRTRLLVFADWLADRGDPREAFVRLHARLLEMHGTEPGFEQLQTKWASWTGGIPFVHLSRPKLNARWLDSICRVCTTAEVEAYAEDGVDAERTWAHVTEYGPADHRHNSETTVRFYHGNALDYDTPFAFVAETLLADLWEDPFIANGTNALARCYPLSRAWFWGAWRGAASNLREPPPLPEVADDNHFLGAQFVNGDWNNWGAVAAYRDDFFALFWSTTA